MINVYKISPGKSYVTIYSNQTGSKLCNEKTSSVCWQNRSENGNCNCSQLTRSKLHDTVIDQGRIVWGCLIATTRVAKFLRWFYQNPLTINLHIKCRFSNLVSLRDFEQFSNLPSKVWSRAKIVSAVPPGQSQHFLTTSNH